MQAACTEAESSMVSLIGLDDETVLAVCEEAGVEVANYNSPGQTVVSGSKAACEKVPDIAKAKGARMAVPLPVAGAFHSTFMAPAKGVFASFLDDITFHEPAFPVYANVSGDKHGDLASIKVAMPEQITSPVRWVENVQSIIQDGAEKAVECGPGKVLSGLVKRIDKTLPTANVSDLAGLEATTAFLAE